MQENVLLEKAAVLLQQLDGFFDSDGEFKTMQSRLKALEDMKGLVDGLGWLEKLKDFDPSAIEERYEKLHEGQKSLQTAIRKSKHGFYIPGVEDLADDFGVLRMMNAIHSGNWSNAGFEKELIDQVKAKYGDRIFDKQSQIAGDDNLGGNFIPDQVIPDVIQAIYTKSAFFALDGNGETRMSVLDGLTGGNVKVPKFAGGLIAYWIGEEDEYAESQTRTEDVTLQPHKLGILVRLTDSMRKFQGFGFEKLLRNDMIRAAAKKIDWTCMWGTGGNNMPLGLAHNPDVRHFIAADNTGYANKAAAEAAGTSDGAPFDFDMLDEMQLYMEEDDVDIETPSWVSSPRAWRYLRKQKVDHYTGQSTNQAYLLGAPMIPDSRLRELIGDYGKTTQISAAGDAGAGVLTAASTDQDGKCTSVVGGQLSEMVFGRWAGIEIEDDGGRGAGFTSDHTYMKLRMYGDIGYREPRAQIVCLDAQVRA
jgi:HK97 family phage major capsid protein